MKKSDTFLFVFLFIISVVGIFTYSFLTFMPEEKVMFAPLPIAFPTDCSESEIKTVWESVFLVDSDGLSFWANCTGLSNFTAFYAYKNLSKNETYVMAGFSIYNNTLGSNKPYIETNEMLIFYLYGNLSYLDREFLDSFSFLVTNLSELYPFFTIFYFVGLGEYFSEASYNWTKIPIMPDIEHQKQFKYRNSSQFFLEEGIWFIEEKSYSLISIGENKSKESNLSSYVHVNAYNQTMGYVTSLFYGIKCEPNWICTDWSACNGTMQNRTCSDQKNCGILFGKPNESQSCACTPNWTAVKTAPCNSTTETRVVWYNDTNNCLNVTAPANTTEYCDADGNNLIGRLNDVVGVNLNITLLKVNGSAVNYSRFYNGTLTVDFIEKEDSVEIVRVRLRHNFVQAPLNLKEVKIEKQDGNSNFGYLIVHGLGQSNKEFRIDRVLNSDIICVKDSSSVTGIGGINQNCSGGGEKAIVCPGVKDGYNCSDGGQGTYLVKGLSNSGVREISYSPLLSLPNCSVQVNCGSWGACINGIEIRVCTNVTVGNGCQNLTVMYNQSRSCNQTNQTTNCTPNRQCSDWKPENCKKGQTQTKECVDLNNCESAQTITRDCPVEEKINWLLILVVVLAGIVILTAIILIIIIKRKRDEQDDEDPLGLFNRPAAGMYSPTHYGMYGQR